MSEFYKTNEDKGYFLTLTVVDWIDVFTKRNHRLKIIESLQFCQKNKGLEIYGFCLMPSHLHLIARADGKRTLSEIFRDFKQFTSKSIIRQIMEEPESRRDWLLDRFEFRGKYLKNITKYKFWKEGIHAEIILTPNFFYEKLKYIHDNPVKEMFVEKPEEYLFSSARNYAGLYSVLDIIHEVPQLRTI
jgi:REP element-mobilizing transposase RayT